MNNRKQESLIIDYKKLEQEASISVDDVMNKVTQEVSELMEAIDLWDKEEMYKEASDVIVNILSVAKELWIENNYDLQEEISSSHPAFDFLLLNGKWNQEVQAIRQRYSRRGGNKEELAKKTKEFVEFVLCYTDPLLSLEEIIENNTKKFSQRVWEYLRIK